MMEIYLYVKHNTNKFQKFTYAFWVKNNLFHLNNVYNCTFNSFFKNILLFRLWVFKSVHWTKSLPYK